MYKNKNNIHVRFASAQPHSLQLSGGKNDLFSPSPLRGSGRKCHFCLPQAEVNSVVPRQNGHECYTVSAHIEARASIFRSGFLGGPLIKFIIPGLLIKQVDIVKCFFQILYKIYVIWHTYATY